MAQVLADFDTGHCGFVHDTQLDFYGQCLATASADGHIRLWDVRESKDPSLLCDLDGHAGAVYQVSWAPPATGVLLASASGDGRVIVWGRRKKPGEWMIVHSECLQRHGAVRAVSWAPAEHGAVLACTCADGTVAVISHMGAMCSGDDDEVEHRWQVQAVEAHRGQANAVSWATPRGEPGRVLGLDGARMASAGDDGVRVWSWAGASSSWEAEAIDTPADSQVVARDVAWKSWDGIREMLASAALQVVIIWIFEASEDGRGSWRASQRVTIGEEVWKLSWADMGSVLLLSCGEKEQHTVLMKQQLCGEWDVMDVVESN